MVRYKQRRFVGDIMSSVIKVLEYFGHSYHGLLVRVEFVGRESGEES